MGSGEFGAGFGGGPGVPVDFSAASDGFGATGGEGMGAADGLGGMEGIGGMGGMGTMGGVGDFNAGDAFGFPAHPSGALWVQPMGLRRLARSTPFFWEVRDVKRQSLHAQ